MSIDASLGACESLLSNHSLVGLPLAVCTGTTCISVGLCIALYDPQVSDKY